MAALISSVMSTKDRVPFYVAACDDMGIEVEPPDVNVSVEDFRVVEGRIRFGLNAVKNVGESAVRSILAAREEGGPFASIWDFCERVDPGQVNKRALESLVKGGALDSTGSAQGMLEVLEDALVSGGRLIADRLAGQSSIFDLGEGGAAGPPPAPQADLTEEFEKRELLALEKESLGSTSRSTRSTPSATSCGEDRLPHVRGRAAPRRRGRHRRRHRQRDQAADDEEGRADGLPPPGRPLRLARDGRLQLRLRGRARAARGRGPRHQGPRRPQGGRDEADRASRSRPSRPPPTRARCGYGSTRARRRPGRSELAEVVRSFPGESEVVLELETSVGQQTYAFGAVQGAPEPDFYAEVKALLGKGDQLAREAAALGAGPGGGALAAAAQLRGEAAERSGLGSVVRLGVDGGDLVRVSAQKGADDPGRMEVEHVVAARFHAYLTATGPGIFLGMKRVLSVR